MRVLMWHVDRFRSQLTEQGRSPLVEEGDAVTEVGEALLVLASVEKGDEANPAGTAHAAAGEIKAQANEKSTSPTLLRQSGFTVHRTPFGWFNSLEISAKGHPLSRVARRVMAE